MKQLILLRHAKSGWADGGRDFDRPLSARGERDAPEMAARLAAGSTDAPVVLLLTDLMMPGETGLDLLQHLADHPAQRGTARVAVFSAGLTAAMQARLDSFDVWRQLSKPISLTALEDCVREAVGGASAASRCPCRCPTGTR